jgi:hypothetical protein
MDRLNDWLEQHLPAWLFAAWCWPQYRLFGRCWAEGCGRLVILHSPWALYLCERTPMAIEITDEGMAAAVIAEAEQITSDHVA